MTVENQPFPFDSIRLYSTPEAFILEPKNRDSPNNLHIDRKTAKFSLQASAPQTSAPQEIFGVIGLSKFLADPYLVVITGRIYVGKINNNEVWRISHVSIIPFSENLQLSHAQREEERRYFRLLESALDIPHYYYSSSFDLTRSAQSLASIEESVKEKPLISRVDPRFFWNHHLAQPFLDAQMLNWVIPIMMGYVQIEIVSINGFNLTFALISRRNINRSGTRFNVRGIDEEGNTANNVETEQVLICQDRMASFVQIRGSIPIFWEQVPCLKYTPKMNLTRTEREVEAAFKIHFDDQRKRYGNLILVNLVNQKGSEGNLAKVYDENVKKYDPTAQFLKYIPFDFHHQCKGMRYDRLSLLLEQVDAELFKYGYFSITPDGTTLQKGTVRTNCVDNLDRTNVVQTLFGKEILNIQLRALKIIKESERIEDYHNFERIFKDVWANNADFISLQYSGTGALKNDFTRTGKRDATGILNDGLNSVTRYYLNNFSDGYRQDCFEVLLGRHIADPKEVSPFRAYSAVFWRRINVAAVFGVLVLVSIAFPAESWSRYLFLGLIWGSALLLSAKLIPKYGSLLVDRPCLVPRKTKQL